MRSLFSDDDFLDPPATSAAKSREPAAEAVLSVAELTEHVKDVLEGSFPAVWVAGEISNCSKPQSGHCYLTLKDSAAQIRAVMWRSVASRVRFDLHDGLQVICFGSIEVYAPRGSYQLVIQHMQPLGIGALELALRQLQARLAAEGLFDAGRKRPLPAFPKRIAVITSPTGAAIRDFLQVLARRWRGVHVLIMPVRVQGDLAASEIAAAIMQINEMDVAIDCVVVTRGGGSLEDLWPFNEEQVVRAIHASLIPVVSAVGHEIDVTLSDLVADVRALTPSEAAERIVPSHEDMLRRLEQHEQRLTGAIRSRLSTARARLDGIAMRRVFQKPLQRVHDLARRLDELAVRAASLIKSRCQFGRRDLDRFAAQLESLSPLRVLGRGYSLTWRQPDDALVRDASQLQVGDTIRTRYDQGESISRVERVVGKPDTTT